MKTTSKYRMQLLDTDTNDIIAMWEPGSPLEMNFVNDCLIHMIMSGAVVPGQEAPYRLAIESAIQRLKDLAPPKW